MRSTWLRAALRDLDAEVACIAEQNQEAARHLYVLVRERTAIPAQFPDPGRPGRVFGTRELVLERYPCIIPYRVRNDTVEILRLFHTSRKQLPQWQGDVVQKFCRCFDDAVQKSGLFSSQETGIRTAQAAA